MKNKYLVANPMGCFLVRCNSMKEVNKFVDAHLKKCQDAYIVLTGGKLTKDKYQVRDLTEVPVYK